MVRAAGAFAQLLAREGAYAQIRLRSGEVRRILIECRATIGTVGNEENSLRELGKPVPSVGAVFVRPSAAL